MRKSINNRETQKRESNQFLKVALEQVPRLLGQLNRNPSSCSYGSFDRAYWHYRTNDISSARYQEAVYTLALLYCSDFEGNIYYRDRKLLEWIRATLRFTARLQRRDGSFDEWFINEGSYVATAFLSVVLAQTAMLFRENETELREEKIISGILERAVQFLLKSREETVMNQVSGAVCAIAYTGHILGKKELFTSAGKLFESFLSRQSGEGWWSEYGGPDIGYLSLTISYLNKYRSLTGEGRIDYVIAKAKAFLEQFINPDGTAGGEYMARNTEYIIPSKALPYLGAVKPAHLDDRYLCYILYNWIETGLQTTPQTVKLTLGEKYFPESSLLRIANECYFLVANGNKGGSFRLHADGKAYYDSGVEIVSPTGNLSTGIMDCANNISFYERSLSIRGEAKKIKEPVLGTKTAIVFKLWQTIFGRISFLQKAIKSFLRSRMISYSEGSTVSFKRTIQYGPRVVVVTDTVYGAASKGGIMLGVKASYSAVPSSKYATTSELSRHLLSPGTEERENSGVYIIRRTFSFD